MEYRVKDMEEVAWKVIRWQLNQEKETQGEGRK